MSREHHMRTLQKEDAIRMANDCANTGNRKQAAYHIETAMLILQAERDEIGRQIARLKRLHADFTGLVDG